MKSYILDRIEGSFAVMEDENGDMNNMPLKLLKGEVKEGNIYSKEKEVFIFNEKLTKKRKDEIYNLTEDMWK